MKVGVELLTLGRDLQHGMLGKKIIKLLRFDDAFQILFLFMFIS